MQKAAYDLRVSDWSSDVCSSDLREILDALALIVADEFLDLRILVLAFVQGNADRAVGGDHRLAEQPRRLALDVEIFLLLEAEQLGVEARPGSHLAAPDVVREMIEQFRSEEHTSELQSLMRLSYAAF